MFYYDAKTGASVIEDFLLDYNCDDLDKDLAAAGYPRKMLSVGNEGWSLEVFTKDLIDPSDKHFYPFILIVDLNSTWQEFAIKDFYSLVELLNKFEIFFPGRLCF